MTGSPERPGALEPGIGIVALVPDRWTDRWMARHQILSRMARYFQVAWLDPPRHWRTLVSRPRKAGLGWEEPTPGLVVQRLDWLLPEFHRPEPMAAAAFRARIRIAARRLRRRGATRLILYLWRPQFGRARAVLDFELVCYHVTDEYTFSPEDHPVPPEELELLRAADQVFIHSPALMEKKGKINPQTALIPNGVDYRAFAEPRPQPRDLRPIPGPRIGYSGMLKRQLDWPLLRELAGHHPEWQFVFVGERSPHPELEPHVQALKARANVHFLGAKGVEELPAYPQHFDVCLMPYRVDDYTKFIYPLKLHEYLASGKPVVSAPIRSVREFSQVVSLASTAEEWSAALERALSPAARDSAARRARQEVAQRHDWDELVLEIARIVGRRLAPEIGRRIEEFAGAPGRMRPPSVSPVAGAD